jgi:hypothetical protein
VTRQQLGLALLLKNQRTRQFLTIQYRIGWSLSLDLLFIKFLGFWRLFFVYKNNKYNNRGKDEEDDERK